MPNEKYYKKLLKLSKKELIQLICKRDGEIYRLNKKMVDKDEVIEIFKSCLNES